MFRCTSGQLIERTKGGQKYYRLRLNLVDETAKNRKDRYKDKYLDTGLLVGGRTGKIKNINLANEMLTKAIREYTPVGASMQFYKYCEYWVEEMNKNHELALITREGYEYRMGYVIRYFKDKDLTLADISASDLRAFMNSLYEHEKLTHTQRSKIGLSDRYIRDIMVTLKQVFKFAIDNGHLYGVNPASKGNNPQHGKDGQRRSPEVLHCRDICHKCTV